MSLKTLLPSIGVAAAFTSCLVGQFGSALPFTIPRQPLPGSTRAVRIVATDMTGDLTPDLATLTETGQFYLTSAPTSGLGTSALTLAGITDIAGIPAPSPGASGAVLAAVSGGLRLIQWSYPSFTTTTLTLPGGWPLVAQVETKRINASTVLIIAIATDGLSVRVGSLGNTPTISHLGTITSTTTVRQALFHELQVNRTYDVMIRTSGGLRAYTVGGAALASFPEYTLPPVGWTGGPMGTIQRAAATDQLVWVVDQANVKKLRVFGSAGIVQTLDLSLPGLGSTFDLKSLDTGDADGDGDSDVVLHQFTPGSNGIRQYVIRNDNTTLPFSVPPAGVYEFNVAGLSATDLAGVLVADMNNSGSADAVFAWGATTSLALVTGLAYEMTNGAAPPPATDYLEPSPAGITFASPFEPVNGNVLKAVLNVPPANRGNGWLAEIVTRHQWVNDPIGPNWGWLNVEPTPYTTQVATTAGATVEVGLRQPFASKITVSGQNYSASHSDHYYLWIRFVKLSGTTVVAASPIQVVGLLLEDHPPSSQPEHAHLNYMRSISGPGGTEPRFTRPKMVGDVKKGPYLNPPMGGIPPDA